MVYNLARYMRTKSFEFNQEHPDNAVIIKDIKRMANFDIAVNEEAITMIKSDYKQNHLGYSKKANHGKKNFKNQKNNRRTGYSK